MNKVYNNINDTTPLTLKQLKVEAGFKDRNGNLYEYDGSRITGNMCDCRGNGEFVLLPKDDPAVIEGGKRYMECRKCGMFSHL